MTDKRIARRVGVAIVAVILGSLIGYGLSTSRLDRSSKAYAERSVTQIVTAWSEQELLNRASDQFREAVDPAELRAGFDVLGHRLGAAQDCAEARGKLREEADQPVMAFYDVPCRFENGAATVRISLVRAGSDWQILGFTIDSPALRRGDGSSPGGLQPYKNEGT